MKTNNNCLYAEYDNQMLRFLVDYCEEESSLQTALADLYYAYLKSNVYAGIGRSRYAGKRMHCTSFYNRLQQAGFERCYAKVSAIGGTALTSRNQEVVVIKGLGLKSKVQSQFTEGPYETRKVCARKEESKTDAKESEIFSTTQDGPCIIDLQKQKRSERTSEPIVINAERRHVRINGVLYDRNLIATMRKIKGFKKHNSSVMMTHIITFNNPELRPQYVSESDAETIESELEITKRVELKGRSIVK